MNIKNSDLDLNKLEVLNAYKLNILINYKLSSYHLLKDSKYLQLTTTRSEEVEVLPDFSYLRNATIMSFFMENQVDVPLCFNKSPSLFYKSFEIPHLKLNNLLMRSGNTTLVNRLLNQCLLKHVKDLEYTVVESEPTTWFEFLFITKYSFNKHSLNPKTLTLTEFYRLPSSRVLFGDIYKVRNKRFLLDLIVRHFTTYNPLFAFYVRKVDKQIRKHSRGKSGKYSLVWKYVPAYKRMYTVMRWFLKDVKFQKGKTFKERLDKALTTFLYNPHNTFMGKCRKFNHFFVFLNFRKSLLKTLRSTT